MPNDDVIIVGSLSDKELRDSIDKLVNYVGNQTSVMASNFVVSMDLMKGAMKDFAITQKVSVGLMQDAWKQMSASFDAMLKAQQNATSSGNNSGAGGGNSQYADNTVGHLQEIIAIEEKRRKEMTLGSDALRDQNKLIAEQKNELKEQTTPVASKVLEAALRKQTITLQDAKDKLSMLESIQSNYANSTTLSVTEQNKLTRAITQTKKAIDNLQSKKPKTMKEVLGMDESSVDAIAKKMQALKRVSIDPTNTAQVKQLGDEYQRLKRLQAELMGQNIQMTHSNNYLAQSFGYIRNRLVYAMTLGAATSFAKQVYEIRAQYELLERSLGVLVDSFQRGTETFRELSEMALKSPFTLMELGTAAKQLTAYDFKANEVVDTTRRLADISAALGVPMERLTYNLGQIRAQTRLTARDARDFANAGLPVVKMLADYYSELEGQIVSTGDVYDRMTKRMVSYEDVSSILFKATDEGGKFFDFQAKQAETLKVQLANLSLAWNNMLNDIGKSNQDLLSAPIHGLKSLFENWQVLSKTVTDLVVILGVAKVAQIAFNLSLSKGTIEQIKNIAANKAATSADYQAVFAKNALTKAQAKYLLATNSGTRSLRKYIAESKLLTNQEYIQTRSAGKLKTAWYGASVAMQGAGKAIRLLGASMAALVPQMAALLAISAIVDVFQTIQERRKEVEEFGNTVRKNAEENAKSIHELLSSLDFESASTLSADEQLKAWERLKEEIELSAAASERFISILLNEPDMGERVDKAKQMLKSLEKIHSVMALWKDDDIVITNDFKILGIGADGLSEDLQDFVDAIKSGDESTQAAIRDTELLESGWRRILDRVYDYSDYSAYIGAGTLTPLGWLKNIGDVLGVDWLDSQTTAISAAYQELDDEMNEFVNSLHRQLEKDRITDPFQIKEALEQTLKDAAEAQDWNQEQLLNARILAERKFRNIYQEELASGNQDWVDALDGRTAAWEAWLKYLTTHHNAEFKSMATEQVSEEEWAQDERKRIYEETFETFKKENALAAQEVEQTVNNLNTLQVHIRVFYDQPAPLTDVEQDFSARTGQLQRSEYFRTYAKGAKSQLEVVDNLKKAQRKLTEEIATTEKAGGAYADEHLAGMKKRNDALIEMIHSYKALTDAEEKANKGASKGKKDILGDAFAKEVEIIQNIQKRYNEYRKAGVNAQEAIEKATEEYGRTLIRVNTTLNKYGVKAKTSDELADMDLRSVRDYYKSLLDMATALGNAKGVEALEKALAAVNVEITKFDYKKITDGLNSELGKLKDEYELAVELDADPELGNAFADMMGIDIESLPHTVKEYADKYSTYLNKYLKGKNSSLQFTGDELRGLTRDDITAFREQVDAGSFNQEWFDAILKAYEDISGKRKKDLEETEKWKNSLIEKYGNLQDKLTKIYKDSVQNQVNAVKTFGTEDQKSEIIRLQLRLEATDNPAELANINLQIAEIVKDVTDKNPIALKLVTASDNQTKADTSKAYWEDFKNSELYAMTFEDMANNSTQAIQLIMDKLDGLKDKVKEDPASMKALIKSLEDAQKELNTRDPFGGVARSLRDMANASQEAKTAQEALWRAEVDIEQAQQEVDNTEDGTPEEQAYAQQKLADAIQRRTDAQVKLTQAENKGKKAQENLKSSLQGISNQLGNVKELFGIVSELFRAGGDDDTADAIDAINEGFTIMTTVIMGVVAALVLLEASNPWLLAIAAALSVIVGLVSFLSGNSNKKITEQVEESERAVKRLELAYIDLEHAVNEAYGMATIGANMAAKANKELQLVELKRQLALERSRDSKNRDEDKIIDLQKQIKELEYDIQDTVDSIVNDLLGISSVGDAMENMMGAFIDALRSGEDAMAVFDENVDEMIANMVKKMYVTKILQPWFEEQWNKIQEQINQRAGDIPDKLAKLQSKTSIAKNTDTSDNDSLVGALRALGMSDDQIDRLNWYNEFGQYDYGAGRNARLKAAYEKMLKEAEQKEIEMQRELTNATMPTTDDIRRYAELLRSGQPIMEENMQEVANFLRELGLMKDDASKNLSALQQGIQGITEDTAGALEAYMNGVSQQVYLQSDILTQIRDTVVGMDLDVQTATQAQILLQLQSSYQVQMSIQGILAGVLNPSGRAFSVELVS